MKIYSLIRAGWLAAIPAGAMVTAMANDIQGPSSSATPYLLGSKPGAVTVSILTVGDSVNLKPDGATPYRMAGIPDGLGAFDNGDGTFTLLMNHELTNDKGIERAHGGKGAFVSKWVISKQDLTVVKGQDLIEQVVTWDPTLGKYNAPAKGVKFSRFCSADLPELTAFYNPATGLGYNGRIFMNGEENGKEGRAFAHLMNGTSYELPYLGKFAWENAVAHPNAGDKTIVVGTDDGPGGQVYVYSGQKTSAATAANEVEAAGLTGGDVYGISVAGLSIETDSSSVLPETTFTCYKLGDVSLKTGDQLETASAGHVTTFNRPEDGCWDPVHPNDFYFVTTASFTGKSRLWRLHFTEPANPALGGTIDMLLDGSEGPKMMDNITVTKRGSVFIQEDVGNQAHLGKIWRYSIAQGTVERVAVHDPALFDPVADGFLTQDEESSGIIPVSDILGEGWYLLDVQAHYGTDTELVEGGQLTALHFPPGKEK